MSAPSGTGIEVSGAGRVTMNEPHGQLVTYMSPLFARRSRKVPQSLTLLLGAGHSDEGDLRESDA